MMVVSVVLKMDKDEKGHWCDTDVTPLLLNGFGGNCDVTLYRSERCI
jgi:hypothetical protein